MHDTTPAAARLVREAVRRRTPAQRLGDLLASSELLRTAALARLAQRFPHESRAEHVRRLLGDDADVTVRRGPRPGR